MCFTYILILHSPFLINFLLKEICTAHKHQLLHFKNECTKMECLVIIAFDTFLSFHCNYFQHFYWQLIYSSLATPREDVKLSGGKVRSIISIKAVNVERIHRCVMI